MQHMDWNQLRQDCGFRDTKDNYEFDIAISFAGENRDLARYITESLEMLDIHTFYDEMFEANFLGKTWSTQFQEIFGEQSRFVLCILDEHHAKKIWPTFEREHFTPRIPDESVIPVFLDETKFVGIPQDLIGMRFKYDPGDPAWRKRVDDEIIVKLIDKLT